MSDGPMRLTPQSIQERKSRSQFSSRLLEYSGWITDDIYDLGEDVLVRIYEDNRWSGLSFYVQLKSTKNIDNLNVGDGFISYRFEVKDLKHWSASATPIYLVVWDITETKKYGHWISVWDAIAWLNENNPTWQKKKGKVQVWIPITNATDDTGLKRIRAFLGNYYYPSLAKEQQLNLELTLHFPKTPEGLKAETAVKRFHESGDPVVIDEKFIQTIRFSDWYTRTMGKQDIAQITLSSTPGESVPTRVDVIMSNGQIIGLPYVEFRSVKRGIKEGTISNVHQVIAVHLTVIINFDLKPSLDHLSPTDPNQQLIPSDPLRAATQMQFKSNTQQKLNVQDIKDALLFFTGLSDCVGIRFTTLTTGTMQEFPKPPSVVGSSSDPGFIDLIDKLCSIQQKFHCPLVMEEWSISAEEAELIYDLIEIIETGCLKKQNQEIPLVLPKKDLEVAYQCLLNDQEVLLQQSSIEMSVDLFRTKIDLGPAIRRIIGRPNIKSNELQDIIQDIDAEETREIPFLMSQTIIEFTNWLPSNAATI